MTALCRLCGTPRDDQKGTFYHDMPKFPGGPNRYVHELCARVQKQELQKSLQTHSAKSLTKTKQNSIFKRIEPSGPFPRLAVLVLLAGLAIKIGINKNWPLMN